jgi:hypothetical protein
MHDSPPSLYQFTEWRNKLETLLKALKDLNSEFQGANGVRRGAKYIDLHYSKLYSSKRENGE